MVLAAAYGIKLEVSKRERVGLLFVLTAGNGLCNHGRLTLDRDGDR
jgi:hypothetical protein